MKKTLYKPETEDIDVNVNVNIYANEVCGFNLIACNDNCPSPCNSYCPSY